MTPIPTQVGQASTFCDHPGEGILFSAAVVPLETSSCAVLIGEGDVPSSLAFLTCGPAFGFATLTTFPAVAVSNHNAPPGEQLPPLPPTPGYAACLFDTNGF